MNKRRVIGIGTVLLVLTGAVLFARQPDSQNLVQNPGFESGATNQTSVHWWDCQGGITNCVEYWTMFGNMATPDNWRLWFFNNYPCEAGYTTVQPEAKIITVLVDPGRVHSGLKAAQMFTFWQCGAGGYAQTIAVEPGAFYQAAAFGQVWHSQCSERPHYPGVLDYDCKTHFDSSMYLAVGLDPEGGDNPRSPSVVWSSEVEQYGVYGDILMTPIVQATGCEMTFYLASRNLLPLKHDDACWDDTGVWRVYQMWFPNVYQNSEAR